MDAGNLLGIAMIAVPVLLSLTLHEYGHARVAKADANKSWTCEYDCGFQGNFEEHVAVPRNT